jgi:Transposase DNA-binding/Transposase DDE domain
MRTSYAKRKLGQDFGDARLVLRFDEICDYFAGGLSQTIPEVCNGKARTKACYRFLENKNVRPEKMIRAHRTEFEAQFSDGAKRRLLQISDSTELDFTGKKGAAQLGSLNYVHQRGMLLHNSLLFSDVGLPLGLLWQGYTVRRDEGFGRSKERLGLPIEQKETYRWVEHFEQGQALCREHAGLEVVYVADSEADITELFQCRNEERMHLLVRSKHDRLLADGTSRLYAQVQAQPCAGTYRLQLADPRTQQERTATLEVRFCPVELTQQRKVRSKPDRSVVRLFAVEAREVDPPAYIDEPVRWVLLTSLPVESLADALQVIAYYVLRWLIERFHFLLKGGGAEVEKLQLETPHRLQNAVTAYSIAAFKALKIRYWAEKSPQSDIYQAGVTPLEHEALYTYAHKKGERSVVFDALSPPSIEHYCVVLGKIGGFMPSKKQPLPGFIILTRALQKLDTIVDAYLLFCQRTE